MEHQIDLSKVYEILSRYEKHEANIIPVLQETQNFYSFLPEEVLRCISISLHVPMSKIYGIITFYSQFYLKPRGKNVIKACQGTACHVRGAKGVLETIARELKLESEIGTTDDHNFTLETVACVGTCFLAPVIMVNEDYYGKLTPKRTADILKKYKN